MLFKGSICTFCVSKDANQILKYILYLFHNHLWTIYLIPTTFLDSGPRKTKTLIRQRLIRYDAYFQKVYSVIGGET